MQYLVKLLEIARDAKPEVKPTPAGEFAVSAETVEDARRGALERLAAEARTVRCLSFTADGGIVAVVHPPAPGPAPAPAARRRRGGR
jgi:hypothetical protein